MPDNASSTTNTALLDLLHHHCKQDSVSISAGIDMPTLELAPADLIAVATCLQQQASLRFEMLTDLCGVDYLEYGVDQWHTESATCEGFSRAVEPTQPIEASAYDSAQVAAVPSGLTGTWKKARFAVVYHLLSLEHNHRVRLRVLLPEQAAMRLPSVIAIWPAANWYEREAYDLFGFEFEGHPDLRRILTDYGFVGHPFCKDFPLIGEVEMRYDAATQRCVYEPVSIVPRVLVPKVIRRDNRYQDAEDTAAT